MVVNFDAAQKKTADLDTTTEIMSISISLVSSRFWCRDTKKLVKINPATKNKYFSQATHDRSQ